MTVDLLSSRLKAAKRELTALKTAHARGLGNIKLFTEQITIDPTGYGTGIHELIVSVKTSSMYAPYPFIDILPAIAGSSYSMEIEGFIYRGGYLAMCRLLWLYNTGTNKLSIVSSSPIQSVSYEWVN